MPWEVCAAMDERRRFIEDWERGVWSFVELCDRYGVSRPTGYKWADRYRQEGFGGLSDRSRRPHHCPHATPDSVVELILEARGLHPTWGGKKIARHLERAHPKVLVPAAATVDTIMANYGLVRERRRRQRPGHPGRPLIVPGAPNDLWTVDFKGEFRMGNGLYCYPLIRTGGSA
jgi:putative transposase